MPDDKKGRDEQSRNADNRQRWRDVIDELERWDETEPPVEEAVLDEVETALESVSFPATGTEIIDAVGDHEVESPKGTYAIAELVPDTDEETFEAPAAVRARTQRPTVAAAMTRIVETARGNRNVELGRSQLEAYEKTLRALKAIDADDDDEGIDVITDWILDRVRTRDKLPGSRDVRRRAAKFCRENGYEIRNDEWLGV